ncbi:ferredoxin reductase [Prauserella flavalba]|uniref:Oxidoreductase n=1 Tax=Prauserella flavalba TaxID=1477506 RepID=A0A318LM90_9PSEU|nr:oxidoreductase [Prauserella flavalba]
MARAAVPGGLMGRLDWRVARLAGHRDETPTARTLLLDVPGWPGHLAGQHVDVRLTAQDGYRAERPYSLAAPSGGDRVELTVQRIGDGEVSPFLTEEMRIGDPFELRGPIGGWFVWRPADPAPVLLIAGGSGIVPLRAMLRAREEVGSRAPFRLIYSVRTPEDVYYADELRTPRPGVDVRLVYTRKAPDGARTAPGRLGLAELNSHGWPAEFAPNCFVCGPTGFVETVADLLLALGHDARRVRTERFGPA